jgi:NAD(P)H-dependent flavin oxidoreductase YrpB (nitropropane dioxygenase family)
MTRAQLDRLSPARVRVVCAAAADGCSFVEIAGAAAIHPCTLKEWIRKGEAGLPGYASILPAVYAARAVKRRKLHKQLERAAERDWRAAAHLDSRPVEDLAALAFEGQTRTELIEWAATHPEVVKRVLELEAARVVKLMLEHPAARAKRLPAPELEGDIEPATLTTGDP